MRQYVELVLYPETFIRWLQTQKGIPYEVGFKFRGTAKFRFVTRDFWKNSLSPKGGILAVLRIPKFFFRIRDPKSFHPGSGSYCT
jgi:hypothetical protein